MTESGDQASERESDSELHSHDRDYGHAGEVDRAHEDAVHTESQTVQLDVPEMDCPSCAQKVTNSVGSLDGIKSIGTRPMSGTLTVHYDPDRTTPEAVTERVEAAGYTVEMPDAECSESLSIPEMDCPSCANKVGNALDGVEGLVEYDLQPTAGTADVTYDPETTDSSAVVDAVEGAGYDVQEMDTEDGEDPTDDRSGVWTSARGIKTWISGVFLGRSCVD
jgi:Cd2+/Zn2+-exporting ATPase